MSTVFTSYFPEHPLLKKHLHYIYFDSFPDPAFYRRYSFYPHTKTTLSFYKQATLKQRDAISTITYQPGAPLLKILTRQHSARTVVQKGSIEKIGIVFHPLGINHFIDEPYEQLAMQDAQDFICSNDSQWEELIQQCFLLNDPVERMTLLEKELLRLYRPLSFDILYAVMHELADPQNLMTLETICRKHGISHRSLNREFRKHLAASPELFRMILRFRYAVDQKLNSEEKQSYTNLAYEAGYLDQSYMIRSFKKLTGQTPTQFFKNGSHLGKADTFWKIDNTKNVV